MKKIIVLLLLILTLSTGVYAFTLSVINRVKINTSTAVTLDVSPGNPGDYTYGWSSNIGSITGNSNIVTFNAPATRGKADISVTVNDGGNPVYTGSISTLVFKKIIVIQCNDYQCTDWASSTSYIRPTWKEYMDCMENIQMKFSVGLICETVPGADDAWATATKGYINRGFTEIFFHGITHDCGEFTTDDVATQTATFRTGIDWVKVKLGYTMHGFGANDNDACPYSADTITALNATPEMEYFFRGDKHPGFNGFIYPDDAHFIQTEPGQQQFTPDPATFQSQYNARLDIEYGYTQIHPPWWDNPTDIDNWKTIVTFLRTEGATVLHPYDYARMVLEPTFVADEGSAGDITPPTDIAAVNDGIGADIDLTLFTAEFSLSANWTASSDPESGISRYNYCIGTSQGWANLVGWTDNGTNTSVTRTGLTLTVGTTYYFSVKAVNGVGLESNPANSDGQCVVLSEEKIEEVIGEIKPITNVIHPSEASSKTTIKYKVQSVGSTDGLIHVTIKIYDIRGRLIKMVIDEDMREGEYTELWDGTNFRDEVVASGTYLVRIEAGNYKDTKKIVVIK